MSDDQEKETPSLEDLDREYLEVSGRLLEQIAKREEMKDLLKIAKPAKITELRDVIARLDKVINSTEEHLEILIEARRKRREVEERYAKLDAMMEKMKPEFLAYIVEHHPEKLEEMEVMLGDEDFDKTH